MKKALLVLSVGLLALGVATTVYAQTGGVGGSDPSDSFIAPDAATQEETSLYGPAGLIPEGSAIAGAGFSTSTGLQTVRFSELNGVESCEQLTAFQVSSNATFTAVPFVTCDSATGVVTLPTARDTLYIFYVNFPAPVPQPLTDIFFAD